MGSKFVCNEPQLSLQAQANGAADVRTFYPTRIDTARLQLNGQGDQLDARIADVDLTNANPMCNGALTCVTPTGGGSAVCGAL